MMDIYEIIDEAAQARRDAGIAYEPGEDCAFAVRRLARAVEELARIVEGVLTEKAAT